MSGLGSIYTPSTGEWNGIAQSYNNLGGAQGLGMDLNTWAGSQGIGSVDKGFMGNTMDFLSSDAMNGAKAGIGMVTDIWGTSNNRKAQKQAKKQWEAENSRANEIMAMNREKYDTYKADKTRLNSQYA